MILNGMKRCILYTLMLIMVGPCCSTITITPDLKKVTPIFYADKQFTDHIDRFLELSRKKHLKIRNHTVFGTLGYSDPDDDSDTVGLCNYFLKKVTIDKQYWKRLNNTRREALIFHELGHCTLFRGHTDMKEDDGTIEYKIENFLFTIGVFEKKGYLPDGCPASMMHPYMFGTSCLKKHRQYYIDELFNPSDHNIRNNNARDMMKAIARKMKSYDKENCPETITDNISSLPWDSYDDKQLKWVKENDRCEHNTGLKCVKKFTKSGHMMHRVLCGPVK